MRQKLTEINGLLVVHPPGQYTFTLLRHYFFAIISFYFLAILWTAVLSVKTGIACTHFALVTTSIPSRFRNSQLLCSGMFELGLESWLETIFPLSHYLCYCLVVKTWSHHGSNCMLSGTGVHRCLFKGGQSICQTNPLKSSHEIVTIDNGG